MIQETGNAISDANKNRSSMEQVDIAAAKAVEKFFPIGTHIDSVTIKLTEMKKQDFIITEHDQDTYRDWPNGRYRAIS